MNIDRQEILTALSNPHWEAEMNFQAMDAQAMQKRLADHNSMMAELKAIRKSFLEQDNSQMYRLLDNCVMIYRTGYDL